MKPPAQYDPEAIRKLYDPQKLIAKEQERQNKLKQQKTQAAIQQQKKINQYASFITGPESYAEFDAEQSKNNIASQIEHQIGYMDQRGYKYQHQKDIPFIKEQMALHLSKAGIKDLRQLGYREVETPMTVATVYKKDGQFYEEYVTNPYSGAKSFRKVKNQDDIVIDSDAEIIPGQQFKAKKKNPPTYELINKETGERVVQGKYGGQLVQYDKDQGFRWGNTTRTEGMTDFMIKFDEKGQALIYPRYEDTATDLSGIMTVGSIALAATGAGAGLGASFLGGAAPVVQKAVGNAFINATISSVTGGDFYKSFLTSAAVPIVSSGMNGVLANSIFKDLPVGDTFKRVAGSAINRSVTSGVVAAINGQDIGKAMYRGALKGGFGAGAGIITDKVFTDDNMKFLTDNTNLSLNDIRKIGSMGITQGVYNLTQGRNFSEGVVDTLVSHGVSTSVAKQVGSTFANSFENNPELLSTIQQTTGRLTNLYVKSAMSGRPVSPEMLQQLLLQQALTPTLSTGIQKTKEIAKKAKKELFKKEDPRDNLELAT